MIGSGRQVVRELTARVARRARPRLVVSAIGTPPFADVVAIARIFLRPINVKPRFFGRHIIGAFAFEAARRLAKSRSPSSTELRPLTVRQRECLALVARGKTDWEIKRNEPAVVA